MIDDNGIRIKNLSLERNNLCLMLVKLKEYIRRLEELKDLVENKVNRNPCGILVIHAVNVPKK